MPRRVRRIGITAGDPAGIGPEVALKAAARFDDSSTILIVIGRAAAMRTVCGPTFEGFEVIGEGDIVDCRAGGRYVFDVPIDLPIPVPGEGSADTGRESIAYLDAAVRIWQSGHIHAIVTGPVSKGNIAKSGLRFTGHTEYLAERTGGEPWMMMYAPRHRVLLATTHLPIASVAASLTKERILAAIRAGHDAVSVLDGPAARIAVAGLDPHCGDDGAIGSFDREVTASAIAMAREQGIDVEGPFAADTLFIPSRWERYHLAIAQYHDQGLIPFKMLEFDRGVNITIGLPLVRTSVDHGTAYDIAGRGLANDESMLSAIRLAARLTRREVT